MTEPVTEKSVFAPTDTFWTRDLEGTMHMWSVDGAGKPTLTLGDPPFPPPEGQPFRSSVMTKMLRLFGLLFGALALIMSIVGVVSNSPSLGSFVSWAALVMFALIVLIGFSHYHDKQRALRR